MAIAACLSLLLVAGAWAYVGGQADSLTGSLSESRRVGETVLAVAPAGPIKLSPDKREGQINVAEDVLDAPSEAPSGISLALTAPSERWPDHQQRTVTAFSHPTPAAALDELLAAVTEQPEQSRSSAARPAVAPPAAEESQLAELPPQPTPEEAEVALDALLAEVTEQAERPSATAPQPEPSLSATANGNAPSMVRPAVAPPAPQPASPAPAAAFAATAPFGRPVGEVTAIAPDRRPGAGAPAAAGRSQVALAADGPYRIQLAAVRDEADARRASELFQVDLDSVLSGMEPFIERADTANGVFYRVQIGPFASLQGAETLCDQLKQRNASCFVIRR